MSVWIVLHEYTESVTPYLIRCRGKPSMSAVKKIVKDFKARSGDTIRIIGPYDWDSIPELGKRKSSEGKPTGTKCSVCGEPQFMTVHGEVCKNGHGGAPPMEEEENYDYDPFEEDDL